MFEVEGTSREFESPIVRFGIAFFGVLLLLCAPVAGYFTVLRFLDAGGSPEWPTVAGTVTESHTREEAAGADSSHSAVVRYEYRVGERTYTGSQISLFDVGYRDPGPARQGARIKLPLAS